MSRHNVVRIDVQRFLETEGGLDGFIGDIERNVVCELQKGFPGQGSFGPDSRLKTALEQIFAHSGEGFIIIIDEWDCVFRAARNHKKAQKAYLDFQNVDRPALVIELKWDKSTRGAARQIKEKEYASWFKGYTGDVLLVGINYQKKTKIYECVIEKYDPGENSFLSDI